MTARAAARNPDDTDVSTTARRAIPDTPVTPGAHWVVPDNTDPAAVTVSLAGSTGEFVAGIRSLVEVVAELR